MNTLDRSCKEGAFVYEGRRNYALEQAQVERVAATIRMPHGSDYNSKDFVLLVTLTAFSLDIVMADDIAQEAMPLIKDSMDPRELSRIIRHCIHRHGEELTRHLSVLYHEAPFDDRKAEERAKGFVWNAIIANHLALDE